MSSVDQHQDLNHHSLILEFSEDDSDFSSDVPDDSRSEMEDEHDMAYYERAVHEIAQGDRYICMICTVEMDYTCKMFACQGCYRVFDYECIREWALKSTEKTAERIWKCPNCYRVNKKVPPENRPTCWCGKTVSPEPNPLDPNSCGQTCNASTCTHGCSKICHLGPHPECMRTTLVKCQCGKHTSEIPCYETPSLRGKHRFQCDEECGLSLCCGIHRCKRICHSGLCGACSESLKSRDGSTKIRCYCGRNFKDTIKCKDVKVSADLSTDENGDSWIGAFACSEVRKVEYKCRKHSFFEPCKPSPSISGRFPCPFSPKLLKTCPCGKTPLNNLAKPRKSCTSPIPNCESVCGKKLECGKHTCPFICHEGSCMDPCTQIESKHCSCHQKVLSVPCAFQDEPHCNIKCESLMSCRRHRCTERCCSGRPLAERRRKTPYSTRELLDESLVESQHICLKDCNLTLSCGKHKCQRKCHPGKCPPCLESDSNDLVCPCGKTVVEAPVRCGSKLPTCNFPCIRVVEDTYECGHKPMPHSCHPLEQPCPPCTAPVFKPCKCGKKDKVRTLCFQNDVSCGTVCGKPLADCSHPCQKSCHLPGDCQVKCKQICNRKRINCGHKCRKPCHGYGECPDLPCSASVKINCDCGLKETFVLCGASSEVSSTADHTTLTCDEECERHKRHLQLKEAFGINDSGDAKSRSKTASFEDLARTANSFEELELPFTESALGTYARQVLWCSQIEEVLNTFMEDKTKSSLHFKPMRSVQRHFIRELAKAYKLYAECQDREPKRSVFVKKLENDESSKPSIRLKDSLPIYESFKEIEKEKKNQRVEALTTTQLINFIAKDDPQLEPAKYNCFLLKNLSKGITEEDLRRTFADHLKPTLVKNPQFKILESDKSALIYPEDYDMASANVERDMEALVGHFDYICKDSFIGDGVELCQVDKVVKESSEAVN